MTTRGLLLDTCAMIWLTQDQSVSERTNEVLLQAAREGQTIAVSAMTAWEIGMLVVRGRLPTTRSAADWFRDAVSAAGITVEAVTADILIAASYLPKPVQNDPADRIIIATARDRDLTIITRDRAILAYGAAGHVKTIAC